MALSHQTGYCSYGYFEYDEYYPRWITYNKEPSGWPFLISVVFTLCGVNELYAFFLNNLLLISSLLVVFFMVQNLGGGYAAAWMAALCLGLMPHNLIWSNTIAAEPASAFWTGAGMLLLIVFLNTRRTRHLMLWMLLLPMTCQMRPESALILPLSAVAILLSAPRTLLRKDFFACALPAALFLLPHMLHLYSVSDHSWGAEGAKFSLQFFSDNLRVNGPYYFNNREFPALFTLLALIGLFNTRLALSRRLLLLLWFNLFWGIFLFFYAGSYHYGADVRFALLSFMPLAVLAGYGGDMLRHVIAHRLSALDIPSAASVILLIIAAFTQFLPLIRQEGQEAWGARYDHDHAREFIQHIPRRSIVLTHNPTMFLLWGQNAIQTYAGRDKPDLIRHLMEKYNGNVYFHDNYWCNTHTERNQKLCGYIRRHYGLEKIVSAREQEYEYGLYRIKAVKSEP
jgi:4-amino-4-deoxy-L-arabinose transferase-like glycosyltransferase